MSKSILLYGDSGDGKSTLIGEFAEHVFKTTGKRTRLCSADRGGTESVKPYIDLGIIELVLFDDSDPWVWLNSVVQGKIKKDGKWILGANDNIGFYAFESLTSIGDELMLSLAKKAASGANIGGGASVSFKVNDSGENLSISGNNQSHYGVVQSQITEKVWQSQKLPGWVAWTAAVKRDDDPNSVGKVLGPAVAGKALTGELPRWFTYCFRVAATPGSAGQAEKHILHMGDHSEAGSKGLGNTRVPLDAPKIPSTVEPASLVKAIKLIEDSYAPSLEAIKKRLGDSLKPGLKTGA